MNVLIAILFCASAVFALPALAPQNTFIPTLALNIDGPDPEGSYSYNYETGNGIQVHERAQPLKIGNSDEQVLNVRGFFSYTDPDGRPITLNYVADENGFHPSGEHLPIAPPIPSGILKALEYIAQHPEEDNL